MPISTMQGKKDTVDWIRKIQPDSVLDVGAGIGTYANIFQYENIIINKIDAIEAWKPYIDDYALTWKYNNIFNVDVREFNDWKYDLVIFGDVLEHMSKEDAVRVWHDCSQKARYALISIPIIHSPQGHAHGNPFEEHVKDDWTSLEVLNTFSHIYKHEVYPLSGVGVFYAKFPENVAS